jgi:protein ImuB
VRDGRLVFVKTRNFSGYVAEYSGVWRANSKWWDTPWKICEWDIEIESGGVYRLCKAGEEWFVIGEYD